jgi:hypothetical protein
MTNAAQTELFTDLPSTPVSVQTPRTVPEALTAGHAAPLADNPFLWSSTLWEAFNLGQYLAQRGLDAHGFRKSRGSKYVNAAGLIVQYYYDRSGWCLTANR